jgi:hypothetical protein
METRVETQKISFAGGKREWKRHKLMSSRKETLVETQENNWPRGNANGNQKHLTSRQEAPEI